MKRILFFLTCVLTLFGVARAEDKTVTFDFENNEYGLTRDSGNGSNDAFLSNGQQLVLEGATVTFNGENGWRLWTDGLREYYKNSPSFTVSAGGNNVKSVSWTVVSGATFAQYGTTNNITSWSGSQESVTFVSTASSNKAVKTITITFESGDTGKKNVTTFAYSALTATYDLKEGAENSTLPLLTTDPENLPVTYSSSKPEVASVESNGTVTPLGKGETTITASFAGNEQYNSTTTSYTLTVIDSTPVLDPEPSEGEVKDVLTFTSFTNDGGNTYKDYTYKSQATGITYNAFMATNQSKSFQFKSNDSNSGLVTKSNPNGYVLKSVAIKVYSGDKTADLYGDNEDYESPSKLYNTAANGNKAQGTKIGSLNKDGEVVPNDNYTAFGLRSNSGALYLSEISLTWVKPDQSEVKVSTPLISCENNKVTITCATTDATIYYTIDGNEPSNGSTSYNGPFPIDKTTTIKAIAYVADKASPVATEIAYFMPEQPMTVAEALTLIMDGYEGELTTKGIVNRTTNFNNTHGSITYFISDDGTNNNELQVYGGLNIGGARFNAQTDIEAGATVVVKGKVKIYDGTPEFDSNNELVEYTAPKKSGTEVTLSFAQDNYTASIGDTFEMPVLNIEPTEAIDYVVFNVTPEDSPLAKVNADGNVDFTLNQAGSVTITATLRETDEYYCNTPASFTLKVEDPEAMNNNYVLVSDVSKLSDGAKIVIVNTEESKALGTTQNSNNRKGVDIEITDNIAYPGEDVEIITLILHPDGKYSFKVPYDNGDGYLYAAGTSTGGNNLKTQESISDAAKASITLESNNAKIQFGGDAKANILQYNPNKNQNEINPLFSCYTGTQKDVQIFMSLKKEDSDPETPGLGELIATLPNGTVIENNGSYTLEDADTDGEELIWTPSDFCENVDVLVIAKATVDDETVTKDLMFSLTVVGKAMFNFNEKDAYGMTTLGGSSSSYQTGNITAVEDDVTLKLAGRYRLWENNGTYDLRVYSSGTSPCTMNFSVPFGFKLSSIEFVGSNISNLKPSTGTLEGNKWVVSDENCIALRNVEFSSATGNSNITAINVYYIPTDIEDFDVIYDPTLNVWAKGIEWTENPIELGIAFFQGEDDYSDIVSDIVTGDEIIFIITPEFETDENYEEGLCSYSCKDGEGTLEVMVSTPGLYKLSINTNKEDRYSVNGWKTFVLGELNIYPSIAGLKLSYDSSTEERGHKDFKNEAGQINYEFELSEDGTNWYYEQTLKPILTIEDTDAEIWYKFHDTDDDTPAINARRVVSDPSIDGYTKIVNGDNLDLTNVANKSTKTAQMSLILVKNNAATPVNSDGKSESLVTINAKDVVTAVEAIEADGAEAEYFTVDGVKVANPDKGIYIKVVGNKATKVIL